MKPPRRSFRAPSTLGLVALACAPLIVACGSGGGGGGGEGGSVDVLIGDAPADELLAFRATIDSLRLVRQDGLVSSDVIIEPVELELLGLTESLHWLTSLSVQPGTYTSVILGFEPASYVAVAQDGSPIAVNATSNALTMQFPTPFVVGAGSYDRLSIDVDLAASLTGDLQNPPLIFDPNGTISDDSSSNDSLSIDEFKGLVKGFSTNNKTVNVQAYVDDDLQISLGLVKVEIAPTTLLVDDDGTVFPNSNAFFAMLVHNQTLLEVHGLLDGQGDVVATKIEIEDQSAGVGSSNQVKIEGLVLALDSDSFELAIAEIEKAAAIALPVLASYGNPGSIEVSYNANTKFYLDSNTPTTAASLAVGQKVDVRFSSFSVQPFPAAKVEIESDGAEFEGFTTDLAGLPASFEMRLYSSSHWIPDTVASSSTDVTVDTIGAALVLKTKNDPAIVAADLVLGIKVEVEGQVAGGSTPSAPVIDASKVKVKAGRFEGVVTDVDALAGTMTVVGSVEQTFGSGVSSGTVAFELEPGCVYEQDASSAATLQAAFDGLGANEILEVRVEGIGTGFAGQARAFYVRAEIEED